MQIPSHQHDDDDDRLITADEWHSGPTIYVGRGHKPAVLRSHRN